LLNPRHAARARPAAGRRSCKFLLILSAGAASKDAVNRIRA